MNEDLVKNRKIKLIVLFAIIVFMVLLIIFFLHESEKRYVVIKKPIVRAVFATGYIKSKNQITLRSEVPGYVEKINVKEGDFVKKGSKLIVIKNEVIPKRIEEINATYELISERLKDGSGYIESLKAKILQADENLKKSKIDYERKKALYDEGLVSKRDIEAAEKNFIYAEQELKIAYTVYNDSIISLKKELDALSAKRKALTKELEKYIVTAPFDGHILSLHVENGDYVDPFKENRLLVIGNKKDTEGVLLIDEEYVPLIKKGQKVIVSFDAFADKNFEATIKNIDLNSDRTSRAVEARIDIRVSEDIPLNSVFEASIILEEKEALVIPEEAYRDGYVWLKNGSKKEKQKVEVGKLYLGYFEVLSGLKEGQILLLK